MKAHLFALAAAGAFAAGAFEKIALVDNFDFGMFFDLETASGEEQVMRHALETGCDKIWWRVMSGAVPRYRSAEERTPSTVPPFDLRRLPLASPGGWTHFERMPEDLFGIFRRLSEKYGVGFGAHWTVEEAHWCDWSVGAWNLEHPQFWCRNEKGIPWPGKASLAFPEVLAHKLRLVDEIIATGVETIYIDTCRYSGWTPSREFVKPNIDRWRSLYGDAPLPLETARRDARWLKIIAENEMRYLREIRKRLDRAVPRRRLALGLEETGRSEADGGDFMWHERALDWRQLAAEGTVDDLVVICVRIDKTDPWRSARRVYDSVVAAKGRAKVYFPVRMYDFWNTSHGIPTFMKASGLNAVECGKRLLAMAHDAGGDGIVMECVDYNNYPKELREVIRTFGKETMKEEQQP